MIITRRLRKECPHCIVGRVNRKMPDGKMYTMICACCGGEGYTMVEDVCELESLPPAEAIVELVSIVDDLKDRIERLEP